MPYTNPTWEEIEARVRLRKLGQARKACKEARREYNKLLKPFTLMEEERAQILVEKEAAEKLEALKLEEDIKKLEPPKEYRDVGCQTEDDAMPMIIYLRELPSA